MQRQDFTYWRNRISKMLHEAYTQKLKNALAKEIEKQSLLPLDSQTSIYLGNYAYFNNTIMLATEAFLSIESVNTPLVNILESAFPNPVVIMNYLDSLDKIWEEEKLLTAFLVQAMNHISLGYPESFEAHQLQYAYLLCPALVNSPIYAISPYRQKVVQAIKDARKPYFDRMDKYLFLGSML